MRYPPDTRVLEIEPVQTTWPPARWTLKRIRASFPLLAQYNLSGVWRWLRRNRLRLRQGRPQQYSPDPAYRRKFQHLLLILNKVRRAPERLVVLFVDEHTYHHWPLPAADWCDQDGPPPLAQRAAPGERQRRLVAGLNGRTGQVIYRQANRIDRWTWIAFLRQVQRAYPQAHRIYLVLDNWPTHFSAEALALFQTELTRLRLIRLPTYAPWLNPIEKLWDWLEGYLLKLHRLAGQWDQLQDQVTQFLDQFADSSASLLRRVGLAGNGTLAQALFTGFDRQT